MSEIVTSTLVEALYGWEGSHRKQRVVDYVCFGGGVFVVEKRAVLCRTEGRGRSLEVVLAPPLKEVLVFSSSLTLVPFHSHSSTPPKRRVA